MTTERIQNGDDDSKIRIVEIQEVEAKVVTPPLLGRCRRVGGKSPSEELPIYVRESVLHPILEHVRGDLSL